MRQGHSASLLGRNFEKREGLARRAFVLLFQTANIIIMRIRRATGQVLLYVESFFLLETTSLNNCGIPKQSPAAHKHTVSRPKPDVPYRSVQPSASDCPHNGLCNSCATPKLAAKMQIEGLANHMSRDVFTKLLTFPLRVHLVPCSPHVSSTAWSNHGRSRPLHSEAKQCFSHAGS